MKPFAISLLLTLVAAGTLRAAAAPTAGTHHSGQMVVVDPAAGTLRFEEMLAWTGPSDRRRRPHGPAHARDRPGGFVTVTTGGDDTALALEVMRPER